MDKIIFSDEIAWQIVPDKSFAYACNMKTRKYYEFEDTELMIWMCIAENVGITLTNLQNKVANYYNVSLETVVDDVSDFVKSLFKTGLVKHGE
ncbi:MAG: hypothetical protein SPL99_01090 [Catonella sp.]|nr:hypothetical protein [Catonella sp.]